MKHLVSASAIAIALMFGISSCANQADPTVLQQEKKETQDLSFKMALPQSVVDSTVKPVVTVFSGDSLVAQATLVKDGKTIGGTISSLPAGQELKFALVLYGADNEILYEGSALSTLKPGVATEVKIILKPTTGTAVVVGVLESDSTLIDGSSVTIKGNDRVEETYIAAGSYGDINLGESGYLQVGYYDPNTRMRGLIKFNASSSECSNIKSAVLEMTTQQWMYKHLRGPVHIDIYPMTTSWNEGKSGVSNEQTIRSGVSNSASVNGATGLSPVFGKSWSVPLGGIGQDMISVPVASDVHVPEDGSNVVWRFDLTKYCTPEQLAKGFMLVLREKQEAMDDVYYDYPIFYTSESPTADANGPRLIITK